MTDDLVELDKFRGIVAQKDTEIRRDLQEFQADQAKLKRRQLEFEDFLFAGPAETWTEAAAKAQYLIQLFGATLEIQDLRQKELITQTLIDLNKLCETAKEQP